MELLSATSREMFAAEHPDWSIDGETITRTFVHRDFKEAMAFVTRVAMLSEVVDHHPDIGIRWNKVTLVLTTHEAGGLTRRDTELASAIDEF